MEIGNNNSIAKPGKDRTIATNYRPIALTCNLGKILEKIMNRRLKWMFEQHGWISPLQDGFRQFRSTADHLVQLETYICNSLAKKLNVMAVSLDIEKAYEMVWRHRIMDILIKRGFKGHILAYISNFLSNRRIQVRIGTNLSDIRTIHNGVPRLCD